MTTPTVAIPPLAARAQRVADRAQFRQSSIPETGALLRALAASKPGGHMLEAGSGTGVGAAWLLDGMDSASRLISLERHPQIANAAKTLLADDDRITVINADAVDWLESYDGPPFDLAFVDTTIIKFHRRDLLFRHLADGALFIADDLLPQDKWMEDHGPRVERFRREILQEPTLFPALVDWASGLVIAAHRYHGAGNGNEARR
jgi:predicted O-methyltransferase YrrM